MVMSGKFRFVDVSTAMAREQQLWPSIVVPKKAIDSEVERLADMALPATGRRACAIDHPMNQGPVPAFAPGIDVTIHVLKPGERTPPVARNSCLVDMCISGRGAAHIGSKQFQAEKFDVWNTPSMDPYSYSNEGDELFVRLSYSNAPLLERLEVHYSDANPRMDATESVGAKAKPSGPRARDIAEVIDLGADGAQLMGYEYLVDIDTVESRPLLWRWKEVSAHLEKVYTRDIAYSGRHLYLLYNPATERRMGTTHCFFATLAKYPPEKVDRPHRHISAAINYYFIGHGKSTVMGERMDWQAGDLHLSAPGWAVHNHASREQGFCALTVQDHPLHIAMDSLMWQETLKSPILKLGSQKGVQTNLSDLHAA
jgi:gentisate 1,2-dioxygenase